MFVQCLLQQETKLRSLVFWQTPSQAEQWESFIYSRKKVRLQLYPDWRLLTQGSWRQANWKLSIICNWLVCIFGSLWLVLNWKQQQKLGKLSVVNEAMAVWGQWLQQLLFGSLNWLLWWHDILQVRLSAGWLPRLIAGDNELVSWPGCCLLTVGQSSVFIYGLAIVHCYIQSIIF